MHVTGAIRSCAGSRVGYGGTSFQEASSWSRGLASGHCGRTCSGLEKHVFYGTSQLAADDGRTIFSYGTVFGKNRFTYCFRGRPGQYRLNEASFLVAWLEAFNGEKKHREGGYIADREASGTEKAASGTSRHLEWRPFARRIQLHFSGSEIGWLLSINVPYWEEARIKNPNVPRKWTVQGGMRQLAAPTFSQLLNPVSHLCGHASI